MADEQQSDGSPWGTIYNVVQNAADIAEIGGHVAGKTVPPLGMAMGLGKLMFGHHDSEAEVMCDGMGWLPLIGTVQELEGCSLPSIVPGTGLTQDELYLNYRAGAQSIDPTADAAADANAQAQAQQCGP